MPLGNKIEQNLGNRMPAMISRAGNKFTLRDAAGNERPPVDYLDIIFVDGNSNKSMIYREDRNYNPKDPLPPDCWSDNGKAPSKLALKPQSASCATCEKAMKGSATSKVTGNSVAACTTNQKMAVMLADDNSRMIFQFLVTPGNLKAFREYWQTLKGHRYELEDVVTRISFVPKETGILAFEPVGEATDDDKVFIAGVTGMPELRFVTGEDDEPIGALPRPIERPLGLHNYNQGQEAAAQQQIIQPEKPQPTRQELEAQLLKMRAEKGVKPKLVGTPARNDVQPDRDIPAFLQRGKAEKPNNAAFGMTGNAASLPDDVTKLVNQQTNGQQESPLQDRMKKAFNLPLRA